MRNLTLFLLTLFLAACGSNNNDPIVSQAQMRNMQTRTFVGHTKTEVINEIVSVLQDQGYMVKNASAELGILTAEQDTNIETFSSRFWAKLLASEQPRWKKHSVLEMTSNITTCGDQVSVRINFLGRVFDNLGRVVDVHQIHNSEVYTDFFNHIHQGLLSQ